MAKRFTDTTKYKRPFLRSLKAPYKLLWDYLYHDCDHSGVWIVDFDIAQIYIGLDAPINKETAIELFNSNEVRIIEFDNKEKWFIPSFVSFQYGVLNEKNRAHNSVLTQLKKYNLLDKIKPLISPLQGCKDKDKDKDKEKNKEVKIKNKFVPPSEKEFMIYAKTCFSTPEQYQQYRQMLLNKFKAWDISGWINGRTNKPIANWKSTLVNTVNAFLKK